MFVQALEQISKKIKASKNPDKGYKILESKIFNSDILKNQLESFNFLKENTNKLKKNVEIDKFSLELKEKVNKFNSEQVQGEVKSLLEFFNINPKFIKNTVMDLAMRLDEKAIKDIVLNEKRKYITEKYKTIIKTEDENELRKQFQIINFLSETISDDKRKTFIKESLRALLEERYKNYNSCVKKLFKLRTLTEDIVNDSFDEENRNEYGGGKKVMMKDLRHLKRIEIVVPEMWKKPEKIVVSFYIPIYPIGATRSAAMTSSLKTRDKLNRLERLFVNSTIYQKGRTDLFNPVGTIWNVGLKMQAKVGEKLKAGVEIFLNTNPEGDGHNTWEMFYKNVFEMLKEFDSILPELLGKDSDVLSPLAQRDSINAYKKLSKTEKEQQANLDGLVDRDLIKKKLGDIEVGDAETRVDDFNGLF